jgi:hypothetical protein
MTVAKQSYVRSRIVEARAAQNIVQQPAERDANAGSRSLLFQASGIGALGTEVACSNYRQVFGRKRHFEE